MLPSTSGFGQFGSACALLDAVRATGCTTDRSGRLNGSVYVAQFPRAIFIHIHRSGVVQDGLDFAGLVKELSGLVARYEAHIRLRR